MNDSFFLDTMDPPRKWDVSITVATVKRVRKECNINLADAIDIDEKGRPKADILGQLAADPVLLVDVLFVICQQDADARHVTSEEFGNLFVTGEMIEQATDALMNGILNFLPPTKRLVMEKILSVASRNTDKIRTEAEKILKSPEIDQQLDKIWNEQFTNTRESSD